MTTTSTLALEERRQRWHCCFCCCCFAILFRYDSIFRTPNLILKDAFGKTHTAVLTFGSHTYWNFACVKNKIPKSFPHHPPPPTHNNQTAKKNLYSPKGILWSLKPLYVINKFSVILLRIDIALAKDLSYVGLSG